MSAVNAVRGEAEAKIGSMTLKMAATMDGMAKLSEATGRPTLQEMFQRLLGGELSTTRLAIQLFAIGGTDADGKPTKAQPASAAAIQQLSLTDTPALQGAFTIILNALVREPSGAEAEAPNG